MNLKNNRHLNIIYIISIIIITILVYLPSFKVPFILDDIAKIVDNPDIRNFKNLKTKLIYPYSKKHVWERNDPSRPVVYLTFTLNYFFGKLNPFGYHLVNLTVHIFNVILIFILTKKIISFLSQYPNFPISQFQFFSFLVALFFAVHPVNTSAVTYIFGRSVVLSTFFYLLALLLFIETIKKYSLISQSLNLSISVLCFILALFSRQDAVTLPAIILIFDCIFLSDYKISELLKKRNIIFPIGQYLFCFCYLDTFILVKLVI
ncbi:MAG: hypothetical protein AB1349_09715 [Elusimicrobiota bacterium]